MMDGMGMMVWGVFGSLVALLLIVFLVLAVAAIVRWAWGNNKRVF